MKTPFKQVGRAKITRTVLTLQIEDFIPIEGFILLAFHKKI